MRHIVRYAIEAILILFVLMGASFFVGRQTVPTHNAALVKPLYVPNPAPPHRAPPVPSIRTHALSKELLPGVHGVPGYQRINGQLVKVMDLSPLINKYAAQFGLSAVGIAAVVRQESANTINAERRAGGLDYSCGLMQQIWANVQQYVGYSGEAACTWEENPENSIWLGAKMLRECYDYHGGRIPFPWLYTGYNAGCGLPDWYFYTPSSSEVVTHLNIFLDNYRYAQYWWAGAIPAPPPPPARPTPTPHPHYTWHHAIRLSHPALGPFKGESWHPRPKAGFDRYNYRSGYALCWPKYHTCAVHTEQ